MKMQPKSKTKRLENQRKQQHQQQQLTTISITPPNLNSISQFHTFPIGSQVEVTSDEEGFKGAWYLATVIQPPSSSSSSSSTTTTTTTTPLSLSSKHQDKIFVEYRNLLSDENGSTLLQELVDAKFVRPKYPIQDHDKVCFEVNDVVDAFYQDGWWCGVVTHVVAKNKYRVFFPNPPDEMEFESFELRIHKNWIHGNWVLPDKERMRDWNFSPGTAVEVNIDPDNSCDVWFPATFIKRVAKNTFLVEYKTSKEALLRKVAVDSFHIRPSPPSSSNKSFNLLEKVDAFYDFRWLSGVVTKILADRRYIVYFKRTKKEKELSHSDLRLHMEWHDGKWIQSSQDTSMIPSAEKLNSGNKEKTRASSEGPDDVKNNDLSNKFLSTSPRGSQKKLPMAGNEKSTYSSVTPSNKRIKHSSANGNASHSRSRRLIDEPASEVPLSPEGCKSKMEQVEGSNNGTSVNLDSPTPGQQQSDLTQIEDSSQPSDPTELKEENEKHCTSKKRGRPPKSRSLLSGDTHGEIVDQTTNESDMVKPFGPIVVGLTHNGKMIGSLFESSSQHMALEHKNAVEDEAKYVDSSADHGSVVSNGSEQQKECEVTNLKRKRGRPPKVLFRLGSPKTNEAGLGSPNTNNAVAESVEEKKEDASDAKDDELHSPTIEAEKPLAVVEPSGSSPTDHGIRSLSFTHDQMKPLSDFLTSSTRSTSRRQIRKQKKVPTKSVMTDMNEPANSVILCKGKKQKSSKQVVPQSEDDLDNSRMKAIKVFNNGVARDVDRVVAGTSSNASDDDRPLSAWFEGAHSPIADAKASTVGQSGESGQEIETAPVGQHEEKEQDRRQYTSAENVSQDQANDAPGVPDEMPIQSDSTAIVPVDNEELPFVKNSLVWKMIESMEILKRIPQKPHFRPLYNCKEECREGLAIGSMVTFTSLVERISKFQFGDPKGLLDGYLEALVDLEVLGFNVEPVREQLHKMISIKGKFEQAQSTSKEIENQISERNLEKSDINEEITDIDKKIGELMEKRALVMSKKERKDAEIALLQSSIDAVKGAIENAEKEFEEVTTSLR